MFGQFFA